MAHVPEIIDIETDSDGSSSPIRRPLGFDAVDPVFDMPGGLDNEYPLIYNGVPPIVRAGSPWPYNDFLDLEEDYMNPALPRMGQRSGPSASAAQLPQRPRMSSPAAQSVNLRLPASLNYERCLLEVLELFPDISRDHVKTLYDTEMQHDRPGNSPSTMIQDIIEKVLGKGKYPREKDRLNDLKRKRSRDSDQEELTELRNAEGARAIEGFMDCFSIGSLNMHPYYKISRMVLMDDFPNIPVPFITIKFSENEWHFFKTYQSLESADREWEATKNPPYQRLKRPRKQSHLSTADELNQQIDHMAHNPNGYGIAELKREIAAARRERNKEDAKRQTRKTDDAAEKAKDKDYVARNDVLACGICLDDQIPSYKIVHCDNINVCHFTCFDCLRSYAANTIGEQKWELTCCDIDGCTATYSRSQRAKALDAKTIDTLDRLQQQEEIKKAGMKGLSHCPFCDFAAICPPVKVDWEFRCGNPECEKISCRRCDKETHAPKSCAEAKAEQGLDERHAIEEARTAAMIKKCPGCQRPVIKDTGCNKLKCQCGKTICDYCGKDISQSQYDHFSGGPVQGFTEHFRKKCPLQDDSNSRLGKGVQDAGDKAMKKIREENPNISEEDLKIKFAKEVNSPAHVQYARGMGYMPGIGHLPPLPDYIRNWRPPPMHAFGGPPPGYAPAIPGAWPVPHAYGFPQAQPPVQAGVPPHLMGNFGARRRHAPNYPPPQPHMPVAQHPEQPQAQAQQGQFQYPGRGQMARLQILGMLGGAPHGGGKTD